MDISKFKNTREVRDKMTAVCSHCKQSFSWDKEIRFNRNLIQLVEESTQVIRGAIENGQKKCSQCFSDYREDK